MKRFFSAPIFLMLSLFSEIGLGKSPNIIFFISDDVSWNDYGCYGNAGARTPHIDRLAANGIRFKNAYLTASSCSPSRASIVTGRYPHNNGKAAELHLAIADHLPWLPEVLREMGYYTALSGKNHMKRENPRDTPPFDDISLGRVEGNRGGHANWLRVTQDRPKDQPFFFWFASNDAHRAWEADNEWDGALYGPKIDPAAVVVPPFLVDSDKTRRDLASYYNEVTRFDHFIGKVVGELEVQGVLDDTLIFVLSDNGRPFPRAKTRLHDSGMKTALVAHWPSGISDGGVTDRLVSVIDLAPTAIEVAGGKAGPTFQGVSLAPLFSNREKTVRNYAFSEHNWHDYEALGRSVRTETHLYIVNDRPEKAWQGPADSVRSDSHLELQRALKEQTLSDAQKDVFLAPRPVVEFYDTKKDPHQLNNLAGNPKLSKTEAKLSAILKKWRQQTGDSIPNQISMDEFHRETGVRVVQNGAFRGETPGESKGASKINRTGPK